MIVFPLIRELVLNSFIVSPTPPLLLQASTSAAGKVVAAGDTALMEACRNGAVDVATALLRANASVASENAVRFSFCVKLEVNNRCAGVSQVYSSYFEGWKGRADCF